MKRIQAITFGALAIAAMSCGGSDSPAGTNNNGGNGDVTVNASNSLVFAPNSVTISAGQSVTFVFGSIDHNVIFDGSAGAPPSITSTHNASVTRTFNTAGTFAYICSLHNGMGGAVLVGAGTSNTYSGY